MGSLHVNSEPDIFEQARLFLPKYLTPQQTKDLYSELRRFPDIDSYYLRQEDVREELLQGDGWHGFVVLKFSTGERKTVSGLIISNSCDISPQNASNSPVNILFAPLIGIDRYTEALLAAGKTDAQVQSILQDIRKQRMTSVFFLPAYSGVIAESIILLDDIHAHPLSHFLENSRTFLIRLNQTFFYIFLIKLSIHFSRFNENVQRFSAATS
jgi:hypothetical protein